MSDIVGYVEQVDLKSSLSKIISKFYCKISYQKHSYDKYKIIIKSIYLDERKINKIVLKIKAKGINKVVLANNMIIWKDFFTKQGIKVFDGKYLMKAMLKNIIMYIFENKKEDICNENLYVTIDNDKSSEIIEDSAILFKSLNIVTCKLKKLRRLDKKLEENPESVYAITNNLKKGLKRAKIIVNFDYGEKFFSEVKLNRNAIIVNLSDEKICLKNTFKGVLIDNIKITYKSDYVELDQFMNFSKIALLESNIYKMSYKSITELTKMLECRITNLIGENGQISTAEIKNILS